MSLQCAGDDIYADDYPRSAPEERKWNLANKKGKKKDASIKKPRSSSGRKSAELWYESKGLKAPWLEKEGK